MLFASICRNMRVIVWVFYVEVFVALLCSIVYFNVETDARVSLTYHFASPPVHLRRIPISKQQKT